MTVDTAIGKITASKRVLNDISFWAIKAYLTFDEYGCERLAADAKEAANEIYDALEATGFYDRAD